MALLALEEATGPGRRIDHFPSRLLRELWKKLPQSATDMPSQTRE
jgi:hypothetical protein